MFKLQHKLKTFILCLAALFCVGLGLGAQDLKVAVLEPMGSEEVKNHFSSVRTALASVITSTKGFQVIDRAHTDKIVSEHKFQRESFMVDPSTAREMGKVLGVDIIFLSEVTKFEYDEIEVSCNALDITTGEVIAMGSRIVDDPTPQKMRQNCSELMAEILKNVISKRPSSSTSMISGLDEEIRKAIMNNRSNAKWNRNRANYTLEVDLSGVTFSTNSDFGATVYRVTGNISIMLMDEESGKGSNAEVEVKGFTEMSRELIRNKLMSQVRSQTNNIIKDLLSGLDD